MANSVTDTIITGCANIGMSRAMITDAVGIIGSLHEVIPWEENPAPIPTGDLGFLLRYEDICHGSSIRYMRNLSYREELEIDVQRFWDQHNLEIINYCQSGKISAAKKIERIASSDSRDGKPTYTSGAIDAVLSGTDTSSPNLTDIRKCAVACVLDDICRAYKQMNG